MISFIRALLTTFSDLIKQIRRDSQTDHDFSVIWFPRRTLISDLLLEENGVLGEANMLQCPLYFISLEPDLLSLELEDAFGDIYLVDLSASGLGCVN